MTDNLLNKATATLYSSCDTGARSLLTLCPIRWNTSEPDDLVKSGEKYWETTEHFQRHRLQSCKEGDEEVDQSRWTRDEAES